MGRRKIKNRVRKGFYELLPQTSFSEHTFFLIAATLIILFVGSQQMRLDLVKYAFSTDSVGGGIIFYALILIPIALIVSVAHVFWTRQMNNAEKNLLVAFAILTNAFVGGVAAFTGFSSLEPSSLLLIFPLINLTNAFLLFMAWKLGKINAGSVLDEQTSRLQASLGLILVLAIFLFAQHQGLYWTYTFSLCLAVSTNFHEITKEFRVKT